MGFIFANIVVCYLEILEALNLIVVLYDFETFIRSHPNVSNPLLVVHGTFAASLLQWHSKESVEAVKWVQPEDFPKAADHRFPFRCLAKLVPKRVSGREYVKPRVDIFPCRLHDHHHLWISIIGSSASCSSRVWFACYVYCRKHWSSSLSLLSCNLGNQLRIVVGFWQQTVLFCKVVAYQSAKFRGLFYAQS